MLKNRVAVWMVTAALCVGALGAARPSAAAPSAGVDALQPVFSRLLGNPPVVRVTAVPGAHDGAYDQIGVYAEHAAIQGLRIDQLWFRLLGVTLDPSQLRRGTLQVVAVQTSAIYGKVALESVQDLLNHENTVKDVTLTADGASTIAAGTIVYSGLPTHVRMRGTFEVSGVPEIFFHLQESDRRRPADAGRGGRAGRAADQPRRGPARLAGVLRHPDVPPNRDRIHPQQSGR